MGFRTNSLGEFRGLLPRDGEWTVDLTSAPSCDPCEGAWEEGGWSGFDSQTVSDAGWVDIVADEDGIARPLIELPEGEVSGRVLSVVDGESYGIAAAEVIVRRHMKGRVKGDYALPERLGGSNRRRWRILSSRFAGMDSSTSSLRLGSMADSTGPR